jgi:predicted ATPase
VGREWELTALAGMLDRSIGGRGCVVGVVGPVGIGKTRLADEAWALAKSHGVEVFSTFCESHATDVAFRVVARLLRAVGQAGGLDDETARARVRAWISDADAEDMLLLDDLLGIADPEVAPPKIDPDARRRRLTALINAAQLARTNPALFVIEDVHWIDEVSESMLADLVAVMPQTYAMVLITYRPEYHGALAHVAGAQTIALAPLSLSSRDNRRSNSRRTDNSVACSPAMPGTKCSVHGSTRPSNCRRWASRAARPRDCATQLRSAVTSGRAGRAPRGSCS